MKIEILETGCAKCKSLYQNTLEAVKQSGKEAEISKVEDIKKIVEYGVMSTPALVVERWPRLLGQVGGGNKVDSRL